MKRNIYYLFLLFFLIFPYPLISASSSVVINEIMIGQTKAPNNEFIELYNPTKTDIDLQGYRLTKTVQSGAESNLVSSTKFNGTIPANGFFLIAHPDYKDTINADLAYSGTSFIISKNYTITLYNQDGYPVDIVGYGDPSAYETEATVNPENDQSIERNPIGYDSDNNNADFAVKERPTPKNSGTQQQSDRELDTIPTTTETTATTTERTAEEPIIYSPSMNSSPEANAGPDVTALVGQMIPFDGSHSTDIDSNRLNYVWNFGDGTTIEGDIVEHKYDFPGQYVVTLTVADYQFSDTDIAIVNVYSSSVSISEFIPNPIGDDENEWIEIYNENNEILNLAGWKLDDADGGSKPFTFADNTLIAPGSFLVIPRSISGISLNNDEDSVRLLYPDGSPASQIDYSESKEGESIVYDGDQYYQTTTPTPGTSNIITDQQTSEQTKNLLPIVVQTSQKPPVEKQTNILTGSNDFVVPNQEPVQENIVQPLQEETSQIDDEIKPEASKQTANLGAKTKNSKFILLSSIFISGTILLGWAINLIKKKMTS